MQSNLIFIVLIICVLINGACTQEIAHDHTIESLSPSKLYRISLNTDSKISNDGQRASESLGLKFYRDNKLIHSYEWKNSDYYKRFLDDGLPIAEWISDNVVRFGEKTEGQPFLDSVTITNNTNENIEYISISYGKYESVWLFDVAPSKQMSLPLSPRFKPDGSSNSFLGYGGKTVSGRIFEGVLTERERKSVADGPFTFKITLDTKDLHER